MSDQPDLATVLAYPDQLSNWGRWGADDQRGTLNLIAPEHRVAAARLVTEGRTVSCARDLVAAFGNPASSAQMYFVATGEGLDRPDAVPDTKFGQGDVRSAVEYFGLVFHGPNVTHIDALSHLFWKGKLYNDRAAAMTTSEYGALWCSVLEMRDGVVGRGVLLDVPRAEGVDALEPGRSVLPADLDATARAQGVEVGAGDIVLLRTGRWHETVHGGSAGATGDDPSRWHRMAGWHATCLPWFHDRGVAVIGCDTPQEARPAAYPEFPAPAHVVGLVAMGMPLIDNCDLEALSAACAELGRWEFQFVLTPLRISGGTGSPVNPIAVL